MERAGGVEVTYELRARNTALASANKIHDDAVARSYGFSGGLVPGVDVYAYLTHLPAERWGLDWLERGTLASRFHQPVYDGEAVVVTAAPGDDGSSLDLVLRNDAGDECASGRATLPATPSSLPPIDAFPAAPLPDPPPPASPEVFRSGRAMGSLEFGFHADRAAAYLDGVGEELALYAEEGIAHPGWLLLSANLVLSANVRLGPWIHVASTVTHHGLVRDGDRVSTRARVADVFERKGHRFVVLDVLVVAGDRPALRAEHTAIFEPRRQ